MKLVPVGGKYGKGKFLKVDDEDHWFFENRSVCVCSLGLNCSKTPLPKIQTKVAGVNYTIAMVFKKWICKLDKNPAIKLGFKNGDVFDFRRENLLYSTRNQVSQRRKKWPRCTSRFKGVCRYEKDKVWVARIRVGNELLYLGSFSDELAAAQAYNDAAVKYFGEFARLNNVDERPDTVPSEGLKTIVNT